MLERAGLDADRWLLDLDARVLLQRIDPTAVRSRTALTRLLAATRGRDEPELVIDAVRSVGLATSRSAGHLGSLAAALAAWDQDHPEPGTISTAVGLPGAPILGTERGIQAWHAALAGSSADTVP